MDTISQSAIRILCWTTYKSFSIHDHLLLFHDSFVFYSHYHLLYPAICRSDTRILTSIIYYSTRYLSYRYATQPANSHVLSLLLGFPIFRNTYSLFVSFNAPVKCGVRYVFSTSLLYYELTSFIVLKDQYNFHLSTPLYSPLSVWPPSTSTLLPIMNPFLGLLIITIISPISLATPNR